MPFTDTLIARWSILDIKRIWTKNLHKTYTGLQWPSVDDVPGKWTPTVGLLINTIVNGTPIGPPKPVIFPSIYGSTALTPHYSTDHISFNISPRQMGPRLANGSNGPAPTDVESAPFETLIQREYQDLLGTWATRSTVTHEVIKAFVFLKWSPTHNSAAVTASATIATAIANKALTALIAAGSFSNPVTATLGISASTFTKALADAFTAKANSSEDLLYELAVTPSPIPILTTLPNLPTKEPQAAAPLLQLKDTRDLIAVDTYDWLWHRPSPGPGNLVLAYTDVKVHMRAEARTRLFVYRQ